MDYISQLNDNIKRNLYSNNIFIKEAAVNMNNYTGNIFISLT